MSDISGAISRISAALEGKAKKPSIELVRNPHGFDHAMKEDYAVVLPADVVALSEKTGPIDDPRVKAIVSGAKAVLYPGRDELKTVCQPAEPLWKLLDAACKGGVAS